MKGRALSAGGAWGGQQDKVEAVGRKSGQAVPVPQSGECYSETRRGPEEDARGPVRYGRGRGGGRGAWEGRGGLGGAGRPRWGSRSVSARCSAPQLPRTPRPPRG